MENRKITAMNTKSIIIAAMMLLLTIPAVSAKKKKPYHDDQKAQQWKSMENGPWGFSPGLYYFSIHNKYSGAYLKWNFIIPSVKFDESKSGQKRIMPVRVASEEIQRQKLKETEKERVLIEELYREDVARQADRSVDLTYGDYKEDFERMQNAISEGLLYCLTKSNGELKFQVNEISRLNEVLCSDIAYIHKTGIGYELENAKRRKAYEEAKSKMEKLVKRTASLVMIAETHY